jgi:hypothetical protein
MNFKQSFAYCMMEHLRVWVVLATQTQTTPYSALCVEMQAEKHMHGPAGFEASRGRTGDDATCFSYEPQVYASSGHREHCPSALYQYFIEVRHQH